MEWRIVSGCGIAGFCPHGGDADVGGFLLIVGDIKGREDGIVLFVDGSIVRAEAREGFECVYIVFPKWDQMLKFFWGWKT